MGRKRSGYGGSFPHLFSGRALYQLSLVKSSEARRFIPPELPLVELCGYTLGGLYLARYDSSPAGAFDELVALAGLVWNAPTSCAWAARVYVNSEAARRHGLQEVGLPSHLARFAAGGAAGRSSWWGQENELRITALDRGQQPVCSLRLPECRRPAGPRISLSLPSFSGCTPQQPALLRYSLSLKARVSPSPPVTVTAADQSSDHLLRAVLCGRPLVTFAFDEMRMEVQEPQRVT